MNVFSDKCYVIHNPNSGTRRTKRKLQLWKSVCESGSLKFDFKSISTLEELNGFLHTLKDEIKINLIVAGGDGTLNVWINQVIRNHNSLLNRITWCIFPCGTGNDWADAVGISGNARDWFKSMETAGLREVSCGMIRLEAEQGEEIAYFLNVSGGGLDGMIVHKMQKNRISGRLSYLYEGFAALLQKPVWEVVVQIGAEKRKIRTNMILAGLSSSFGGGLKLTPHYKDGKLAVSIFCDLQVWDIVRYLPFLYNGQVHRMQKVELLHCDSLGIMAACNRLPFHVEADGEYIGKGKALFGIAPVKLRFLLPVKDL